MRVLETGLTKEYPGSTPHALAFSPDGARLAVQSPSHGVAVLELPAEKPVAVYRHSLARLGVGFTADGRVAWADDGGIRVYDPQRQGEPDTLAVPEALPTPGPGPVNRVSCWGLAVSADGRLLWAGTRDEVYQRHTVCCWDTLTGKLEPAILTRRVSVRGLAVSRCGRWLAGFGADEVRAWRIGGPKPPSRAAFVGRTEKFNHPQGVAVSADGKLVAATGFLRMSTRPPVYVWETASGKEPFRVDPPGEFVSGVAFHPHRPTLATVGAEGSAVFWDMTSGRELARFAWPVGDLWAVTFDPLGMRCAAAGTGRVVIWDVDV